MSSGTTTPAGTGGRGVEFAHFWQEGDGRRMVEAVLSAFERQHPDVEVRDRSYENHGLAIKGRMLQGDPPSLFVEWPDRNLVPYHQAGALRDLTAVWEENDWSDPFMDGPAERCTLEGRRYAVPLDIHRMNNLFYDVELVEEYGVDPAGIEDPRAFVDVLREFDDDGIVGMHQPMRDPNTVLTLWTNVFIGEFGAEAFEALTGGDALEYEDEVAESLRLLDAMADLASEDASFLDMVEANRRFLEGDSPFFFQGDWVAGEYMAREDYEYGTDWGRANFPGTDGVYLMGIDAVVSAADAPFGERERTFLDFLASPQILEGLNRIKGSIPPRRDVPMEDFPLMLREQYKDFHRAEHYPASHALQVTPDAFVEAKDAFSEFVADRNVARTTAALVGAYR